MAEASAAEICADGSGTLGFGEVRTKEEECKRDSDRLNRFPCVPLVFFL
jgi:hypothetical protein